MTTIEKCKAIMQSNLEDDLKIGLIGLLQNANCPYQTIISYPINLKPYPCVEQTYYGDKITC